VTDSRISRKREEERLMNEPQVQERSENPRTDPAAIPVATQTEAEPSQTVVPAQACPTCNVARAPIQTAPNSWVYVIGDVDPRYPSLAVEKEAIGAMARTPAAKGLSNEAALQKVLEAPENAYLVREMCFVLLVQEMERYILVPHYPQDYSMLVEASRSELSAVIGTVGPIANPDVCNGLTLPYLIFDMIYNFDAKGLIKDLPVPQNADGAKFRAAATDIFNQIAPLIPNGTGTERALAYLLMKDPGLYHNISEAFNQDAQLTSVEVKAAPVSSTQNLVDVVVRTQDRKTGVQKSVFARLALAAKLPYVVSYWQPYLGQ
jgi:hypothetical protein